MIPVNTTFDTVVDKPGSCAHPLVSPFSLHGLWLSRMGQPATQNGVGEVR